MKKNLALFCLLISLPVLCQIDEEDTVMELERAKAAQAKSFQQIQESTEALTGAPAKMQEELKKFGGQLGSDFFMDPKMLELMKQSLRDSKIQNLPAEQIRAMILEKVKGKPLEKIFTTFPILLDISVDVIKDKDALPALMDIIPRMEELRIFGYCAFGLFILGFILKRFLVPKKAGPMKRMMIGFSLQILIMFMSFGYFYYAFHKELSPTFRVIAGRLG